MRKLHTLLYTLLLSTSLFFGNFYINNPYDRAFDTTCVVCSIVEQESDFLGNKIVEKLPYFGSGSFIKEDNDSYYILTAGHLAHQGKVDIRFFDNPHPIPAEILFSKFNILDDLSNDDHIDFTILKVKKTDMIRPVKIIPLGNNFTKQVITTGHPHTEYGSLIRTTIKQRFFDRFYLDFSPHPGRSGSCVLNSTATNVLGIVTRRDGECFSSEKILEILKKELPEVVF